MITANFASFGGVFSQLGRLSTDQGPSGTNHDDGARRGPGGRANAVLFIPKIYSYRREKNRNHRSGGTTQGGPYKKGKEKKMGKRKRDRYAGSQRALLKSSAQVTKRERYQKRGETSGNKIQSWKNANGEARIGPIKKESPVLKSPGRTGGMLRESRASWERRE